MATAKPKAPQRELVEMMAVRAIEVGHDGVVVRNPGDEFELPLVYAEKCLKAEGCWFERVA